MAYVQRKITSFFLDEENDWVAEMDCGHTRHVRHNPPWQVRPWVMNEKKRIEKIGTLLGCKQCAENENRLPG